MLSGSPNGLGLDVITTKIVGNWALVLGPFMRDDPILLVNMDEINFLREVTDLK